MSKRTFGSIREAKEFLADKIVAEAECEGVPLSDVERKMLYFTETGWTLPDMMEVSAEFDRDYDQDEYEAKIAGLIQRYLRHTRDEDETESEAWNGAVSKLSGEDHYLLVLINAAPPTVDRRWHWLPSLSDFDLYRPVRREPGDRLRLWLTALACVIGFFALFALLNWAFGPNWNHFGSPN